MRQAQQNAQNAFNTSSASANQYQGQGSQIAGNLIPGLEREANNPEGYTPQDMNDQLVASEQGAGGANAGIVGQANLTAARSRNSAGLSTALDNAARIKSQTLSENALRIKSDSAKLGQQKQMAAQGELGKIYGIDTSANLEAQGLLPKDVAAETQAGQSGWFQNMTNLIAALKPGGSFNAGGGNTVDFGS